MYSLYHDNRNKCVSLIPHHDDCCNYYMDKGLHVEGKLFDEIGMVSAIIGDLKMSIRSADYEGWLVCDGRAISRQTYSALYELIGDSFGSGDGETTFNLPNAQGRVLGSVTSNTSTNTLSIRCVGDLVGAETHTLLESEMPSHNHGVNDNGHNHTVTSINDDFNNNSTYSNFNRPSYPQSDGGGSITWSSTINSSTTGISIQDTGLDQPHNNMQPTLFIGNTFIYCGVKDSSSAFNKPNCGNDYDIPPCLRND